MTTHQSNLGRRHESFAPLFADLLSRWESRSRDALPADAMLINRHIRELREAIAHVGGDALHEVSIPTHLTHEEAAFADELVAEIAERTIEFVMKREVARLIEESQE